MDGLLQALQAYQTFNPQGWVSLYRLLPMWVGIVCAAVGLGLLLFGGGSAFRAVAGPVGGLIGLFWTATVTAKLGLPELTPRLPSFVAAVLALLGFAFPVVVVFLGVGIPMGLLAGQLVGRNDFLLGFVPALLITGLIGAVFQRVVSTVVASAVGAWLLVIGALAALNQFGGLVKAVANQPWGVIIAAGLFALAGSVYQLAVRPSPEEAERLRAERERLKLRKAEEKALEKRWGAK